MGTGTGGKEKHAHGKLLVEWVKVRVELVLAFQAYSRRGDRHAVALETSSTLPVLMLKLKSIPSVPYFLEIILKESRLMQKPTTSFHLAFLASLQGIACNFFVQTKPLIQ